MDFRGYSLILTRNHRLSVTLSTSIPTYSLSQWLDTAFAQSGSDRILLSAPQQLFIIQALINQYHPEYLGLAPLVQSAWNLCHHHVVDIHSNLFSKNDDTQLFQAIAQKIEKYYLKNNLTDMAREIGRFTLPDNTALVGFSDLSPLEQKLLSKGTVLPLERSTKTLFQSNFADAELELKNLILWAIEQPEALQIGCVIPDLETKRDKILYYLDYLSVDPKKFTISAVKKLADYYFIQDCFSQFMTEENNLKPSEWAEKFQSQLDQSEWIQSRVLNNEEFQLYEKLKDIFKTYKNFDIANKNLSFDEAVLALKNIGSRIPFQTTASKTANIHFLSLLDSKGLVFDKLWVTGFDSRHWPNKSRVNPLLPFPHVVTENRDWKNTATEIIYSYPKVVDDAATIPAKILDNIPEKDVQFNWPSPTISIRIGRATLATPKPIPVDITMLKHHGSSILKDHAACPFRAFAKHRLNAQAADEIQMGFSALARGNLVHEVLEKIFTAINSKEKLLSLNPEQLHNLVDKIIINSLNKHKNIQEIFVLAERSRLTKLALDWLELEKTRENFVVIATEKTLETKLGQLPLKLRIDRIDQIGPNKYLIIDYKTSQYDIRGDYLDEPQLLLYAVVSTEHIDKIAYAYLRTGNSKLKEIPVGDLKQEWETELLKIAEDFLAGNTEVKPKYGEETCRLCDLKSLCRVTSPISPSP